MKTKQANIAFALKKISTKQFAIIDDTFEAGNKIGFGTNFKFSIDPEHSIIAVFSLFRFEQNNTPFLLLETVCQFQVKEVDWKSFFNKAQDQIKAPKGFMTHLTMIAVGTSRGILHAKTENTKFNNFIIPTINLTEIIKEDVIFKL